MMPDRQTPFQIFELLEHILLYLPMRDILLSQQVCWMFRNTVDNSSVIQQVLFFRPSTTTTMVLHPHKDGMSYWWAKDKSADETIMYDRGHDCEKIRLLVNPLLCDWRCGYDLRSALSKDMLPDTHSSMHRMLLTHPRICEIEFFVHGARDEHLRSTAFNPDGLTVGDIAAHLSHRCEDCKQAAHALPRSTHPRLRKRGRGLCRADVRKVLCHTQGCWSSKQADDEKQCFGLMAFASETFHRLPTDYSWKTEEEGRMVLALLKKFG